ncbi:MAG: DNA polymerase IV [Oscillospiraceae bacterium]|nr:DNA polymerase IV [Oscillospiraceae bacterium]
MPHDRHILHCDCNSFYASVEEVFAPRLKLVPMAVAGDPEARHGIILAKNELAKKHGVQTAETVWQAKRKCPSLVLVPPRHGLYGEYCEKVNAIYEQYTPLVERFGIDESFLDVTGCLRPFGEDVMRCAHDIRQRVKRECGITISIGVSWNKTFAKLGSDMKKPDAVTAITRENWRELVFPLPAGDLLFVGKKTAQALAKMGVTTIGHIAALERALLVKRFGKHGETLYAHANGSDGSPVAAIGGGENVKSVGNGFTFKRDLKSEGDIRTAVSYLAGSVASRLRKHGVKCRVVQVAIKDVNLGTISRRQTLPFPTHLSSDITAAALGLIGRHWQSGKPIRTLTVTGEGLVPASEAEGGQLSFFDEDGRRQAERAERLEKTLDAIRERHGGGAVIQGSIIDNDLGIRET